MLQRQRYLKKYYLMVGLVLFTFLLCIGMSIAQEETESGQKSHNTFETMSLSKTLTIEINPPGAGSVTKSPDKNVYDDGEKVKLQANATGDYSFFHWSGKVDRFTWNPLNIYMEEDRTIIANFVIQNSNAISTPNKPNGPSSSNTGKWLTFESGGATSSIGGQIEYIFDWGNGYVSEWGGANRTFAYGKSGTYNVSVRARSTSDPYTVSQWSASHTVSISGPDKHIFTILIEPEGAGRVNIDPDKEGYDDGDFVNLRATANSGYQFKNWTEGSQVKSTSNSLNIYMLKTRTIKANFTGGSGGDETVSTPDSPAGPSTGNIGESLSYMTGGSVSNLGHDVEYQFDWGDGNSSDWGSSSRSHSYGSAGTYQVKARARCKTHTSIVSGWSSSREVTISGTSETYTLTILINPAGSGNVNINPDKSGYEYNERVELTAAANSGYTFENWTGDITTNTSNPITIYMQRDRVITANFTSSGGGDETVSTPDTPAGPSTGNIGESLSYTTGGSVSNLGHDVEYQFDWGDGNSSDWGSSSRSHSYGSAGTYQVKARARCKTHTSIVSGWSSSREVTISGTSETYTLTILINPAGSGNVNINPDKSGYEYNERVELTAAANSGYTFENWTGDITTNTSNPITIYMQRDRVITANFTSSGGGDETVSTPDTPAGPSTGNIGESLSYTTGGSVSNLGHDVEYQFDWGDGNQSGWGSETGSHSYGSAGTYSVRARARCQTHADIVSSWSNGKDVTITDSGEGYVLTLLVNPEGSGTVQKTPDKAIYVPGEVVEIEAFADDNYRFDHWSGDIGYRTNNPTNINMLRDRTIIANFINKDGEVVSIPNTPIGPSTGNIGESLTFETGGSVSNLGHNVEYQFDWGDGSQSNWGDSTADHSFSSENVYSIKARARCATDTDVISGWSESLEVTITGVKNYYSLDISVTPSDVGMVNVNPFKDLYEENENVQLAAFPSTVNGTMDGNIYLEAETGVMSGHFIIVADTSASSGYCMSGLENLSKDGESIYTFSVIADGDYSIWGRCYALSSLEDSYEAVVDGGDTLTWHLDPEFYNQWKWQKISHQNQVMQFNLNAGEHQITILQRDINVRLDKIIITNDPSFQPVGKQELPSNGIFYVFDHWSGDLTGDENPAEIVIDNNKMITAHFVADGEETVTKPDTPSGPDTAYVGDLVSFTTSGSVSSFGSNVEYQFDWGDGSFSFWGDSAKTHQYGIIDTMYVKARGRSLNDTTIVSDWSNSHQIIIKDVPVTEYTLMVTVEPENKAVVHVEPEKEYYSYGETVVLSVSPVSGYEFDRWSGDLSGSENPDTLTMNGNKSVTAHVVEIHEFVNIPITPTGPDSGMVGQSLVFLTGGSVCNIHVDVEYQFEWGDGTLSDWGDTLRSHIYGQKDTMKIKARARCQVNPLVVSEWSGEHVLRIVDTFTHTLDIMIEPTGSGSVNKTPYKERYENGETVILSPLAAMGFSFDYWSGDLSGSDNPAYILMDNSKSVTAHFKPISGIKKSKDGAPDNFALNQNYPNPFNPETTIEYQIPENAHVKLIIYNINGRKIKQLINEYHTKGYYSINWQAVDDSGAMLPSGVYFYRIEANNFNMLKKMLLMK